MQLYTLIEDPVSIKIVNQSTMLNINRSTGFGTISLYGDNFTTKTEKKHQIIGVYGIVKLKCASYIVCVTGAKMAGLHINYPVYEITKTKYFKLKTYNTRENDRHDIYCMDKFFSLPGLYFSEYPIYKSYVDQDIDEYDFLFNNNMVKEFEKIIRGDTREFTLRCMQGYFGYKRFGNLHFSLLSRRSWKRSGMRYFSRGSDAYGYCSNFVESEQVIYDEENICSFVQVRASIPLKWSQKVGIRYSPDLNIEDIDVIKDAHDVLSNHYGEIFYLNLIQAVRYEKKLNDVYNKYLRQNNYNHRSFDFKNMNMERCLTTRTKFIEELDRWIEDFGITFNEEEKQEGVIRTNCIDCLDRTNILQFLISVEALKRQTERLHGASSGDKGSLEMLDSGDFNAALRELWAANGNVLSIQYSGTPSLKSKIITGGNQNFAGLLRDGFFSLKRYVLNRFYQGDTHTGYLIVTGVPSKMERRRGLRIGFKVVFLFILGIIAACVNVLFYVGKGNFCIYAILIGFILLLSILKCMPQYFINFPSIVEK